MQMWLSFPLIKSNVLRFDLCSLHGFMCLSVSPSPGSEGFSCTAQTSGLRCTAVDCCLQLGGWWSLSMHFRVWLFSFSNTVYRKWFPCLTDSFLCFCSNQPALLVWVCFWVLCSVPLLTSVCLWKYEFSHFILVWKCVCVHACKCL